jgi:hypothetical protein
MLKRRPSKRFVLAETGEETAWNTTTDNDGIVQQIPQIDIGIASDAGAGVSEEKVADIEPQANQQRLTVPVTLKSGMK